MKKMIKLMTAIALLVSLVCVLMTGCSLGKPTVNLNDYIKVTGDGFDGYGTIHASVDYEQIVEDYADRLTDKLDTQYFGDKTPKLAALFVFEAYDPYALAYEAPEDAKNGDKVAFSWNTNENSIETLAKVLDVNFKYESFEYEIKELKPLTEVDPFEKVDIPRGGISGGTGMNKAYVLTDYMNTCFTAGEQTIYLDLIGEAEEGKEWKNGDTLHIAIDPESLDAEKLARQHGVVLSKTEMDYVFDDFAYYEHDNAKVQDIFNLLGEDSKENAMKSITEWVESKDEERTIELAGMLYFYNDEGHVFDGWNAHNQLVLIYHIDNGKVPGGWYTYLSPNNDMVIGYQENDDGTKTKASLIDTLKPLTDSYFYYSKETGMVWRPAHPVSFEHDGVTYIGHQTIEECVAAYVANQLADKEYDHLTISSNLFSNATLEAMIK